MVVKTTLNYEKRLKQYNMGKIRSYTVFKKIGITDSVKQSLIFSPCVMQRISYCKIVIIIIIQIVFSS